MDILFDRETVNLSEIEIDVVSTSEVPVDVTEHDTTTGLSVQQNISLVDLTVEEVPISDDNIIDMSVRSAYSQVSLYTDNFDRLEVIKALNNRYTKAEADATFVKITDFANAKIFHYSNSENPYDAMYTLLVANVPFLLEKDNNHYCLAGHLDNTFYFDFVYGATGKFIALNKLTGYTFVEKEFAEASNVYTKEQSDNRFRLKTDKVTHEYSYTDASLMDKFDEIIGYVTAGDVVVITNNNLTYGLTKKTSTELTFTCFSVDTVYNIKLVKNEASPRAITSLQIPKAPSYYLVSSSLPTQFTNIKNAVNNGDIVYLVDLSNNGRILYNFSNFVVTDSVVTGLNFSNVVNNKVITVMADSYSENYIPSYNTLKVRIDALEELTEDMDERLEEVEDNYLTLQTLPRWDGSTAILGESVLAEFVLGGD